MANMNKNDFISTLSKQTGLDLVLCREINDILERNFFLLRKNKSKVISDLVSKIKIDYELADLVYEKALSIVKKELSFKIKHPFKNR